MKYKNILIILIIIFVVIVKILKKQLKLKHFFNFSPVSISFKQIYDIKEYLVFFIIIIPLSYFLMKSNMQWEQEQVDLMEKREEINKRNEIEKRKQEFEIKMRGIHFKEE